MQSTVFVVNASKVRLSLTFLVAADHVVPVEAGEVPLDAEPEPVARPLQHPPLVLHLARQRHVLALYRRGSQ